MVAAGCERGLVDADRPGSGAFARRWTDDDLGVDVLLVAREAGTHALDAGGVAGDGESPATSARRSMHEVETGAHAVVEVDDDEGIVDDVAASLRHSARRGGSRRRRRRHDANRLGAGDQAHEVEKWQHFSTQAAAGAAGEAVPVVDLLQERVAVLPSRSSAACRCGRADFVDHEGDRRHVADRCRPESGAAWLAARSRAGRRPRAWCRSGFSIRIASSGRRRESRSRMPARASFGVAITSARSCRPPAGGRGRRRASVGTARR